MFMTILGKEFRTTTHETVRIGKQNFYTFLTCLRCTSIVLNVFVFYVKYHFSSTPLAGAYFLLRNTCTNMIKIGQ